MKNPTHSVFHAIIKSAFGLFIYSCGAYLIMQANIGVAPWECLSMAISPKIGISFGMVHMFSGILILSIDLLLKEKIGIGTILDIILVGNYVDLITYFDPLPHCSTLPFSIAIVISGLFIMGYGQYFYMSAGLSCGPRDSLLIALGKRCPDIPIGFVQTCIIGIIIFASMLLDGPIGIGTLLSVLFAGTALQTVCHLKHFEPRTVIHKNLFETIQILSPKKIPTLK